MSWLDEHHARLNQRSQAFEIIQAELLRYKSPHILETGGLRTIDNVEGDGNSTLFFNDIVHATEGRLVSIDIDASCAENVRKYCGSRVWAYTENSLTAIPKLWSMSFNCVYLDSLDVNFEADEPAARHAFNEYLLVRRLLSRDALVCVDDNDSQGRGKGRLIAQLADLMRWECLSDGYVKVWRTNGYL